MHHFITTTLKKKKICYDKISFVTYNFGIFDTVFELIKVVFRACALSETAVVLKRVHSLHGCLLE